MKTRKIKILAAITTCRRKPEMVERAIKSVLAQTYKDWYLVVVDDSPNNYEYRDSVRKMIEGYGIKYIQHDKNYGVCRARNTALNFAYASGEYDFIAYLDDDDEWLPEKLEKSIARFSECNQNTAVVYSGYYLCYCKRGTITTQPSGCHNGNIYDTLMFSNIVGFSSLTMIRTQYLHEVGGFDELQEANEDYELWIRLAKHGYEFACINEPLLKYHMHDGERIFRSAARRLSGMEIIINKNKEYYANHKYPYWRHLLTMSVQSRQAGNTLKALRYWCKAISLQPQKILPNV